MSTSGLTSWSGSLHQTWRLLPVPAEHLQAFLAADGLAPDQVLDRLPYAMARSRSRQNRPDPRRYREARLVYQHAGLAFQRQGKVQLTPLGRTVLELLPDPDPADVLLVAAHAVQTLGAAQLRNPTASGRRYADIVRVHPFSVIWRIMLACDGRITSEELNRVVFNITDDQQADGAATRLMAARRLQNSDENADLDRLLGHPAITQGTVNDRIIPWIALASFGWSLMEEKGSAGEYQIKEANEPLLQRAAAVRRRHHEFQDEGAYFDYLSRVAALDRPRAA